MWRLMKHRKGLFALGVARSISVLCGCLLVLAGATPRSITHAQISIEPRAYIPILVRPSAPSTACAGEQPVFLPTSLEYTNPYSETILLGEICNPRNEAVTQVKFAIDALDAGGNVIETIIDTDYRNYGAGMVLCVSRYAPVLPRGLAAWRYRVLTWSGLPPYVKLVPITVIEASYEPAQAAIIGRVRNDSASQPAQVVYVSASIHNKAGEVLGCHEQAAVNSLRLEPRQITSFRARFPRYGEVTELLYAQYDHQRVVVTNQ